MTVIIMTVILMTVIISSGYSDIPSSIHELKCHSVGDQDKHRDSGECNSILSVSCHFINVIFS